MLDWLAENASVHFFIGAFNIAHVSAEPVLIQLLVCFPVPEAAGVRGYFIGKNDSSVRQSAKFHFKVYKLDVYGLKEFLKDIIDLKCHGLNMLDFVLISQFESQGLIGIYQWVV